jgi:ribosomal protein S18 acetylase RimI-like enzyme
MRCIGESAVVFRVSETRDITGMALIRTREWGEVDYRENRISGYLQGRLGPHHALAPRRCYIASAERELVGFVAGHLTRRYDCAGEIQWINVTPEWRGKAVASELLGLLAGWFVEQGAHRVCVDVDPSNDVARAFYRLHRAEELNRHWLFWNDISVILER